VIVGALLAAGIGSRLGRPKALLDWHGRPLVRHLAEVAVRSGLDRVIVVVGPQAEEVRRALRGLPVDLVYNYYFGLGQSTSVQAALGALPPGTEAVLFLLVDQPFISPDLIRSVIDAYRRTGAPVVVPRGPSRPGNPILFGRTLFVELLGLRGDRGGRVLIQRYADRVAAVPVGSDEVFLDIDTWEDYQAALRRINFPRPSGPGDALRP